MTAGTWVAVLYLALFVTVVGYVGWMVALRYVAASTAATTLFLQPLVGTALAVLLLGERPSAASLVRGSLHHVRRVAGKPSRVAAYGGIEAKAGALIT